MRDSEEDIGQKRSRTVNSKGLRAKNRRSTGGAKQIQKKDTTGRQLI
jgi:hypothetical protein